MFYHVLIKIQDSYSGSNFERELYELDKENLQEIEDEIIIPYLKNEEFVFDKYLVSRSNIIGINVCKTRTLAQHIADIENSRIRDTSFRREDVIHHDGYSKDITRTILSTVKLRLSEKSYSFEPLQVSRSGNSTRVFIVHGHDALAKNETARFIEKLGFEAVILHEQASSGMTIIEKIECYTDVDFAIVLYTPCDVGASKEKKEALNARARQNVVFEHGYLISKLGRSKVCALVIEGVEHPSDVSGIVYVEMDSKGAWKSSLAKELDSAGYNIDFNLLKK